MKDGTKEAIQYTIDQSPRYSAALSPSFLPSLVVSATPAPIGELADITAIGASVRAVGCLATTESRMETDDSEVGSSASLCLG